MYPYNDTIIWPVVPPGTRPYGMYGVSLSSMGQITIDQNNDIYVTYSSCNYLKTVEIVTGVNKMYRNIYARKKPNGSTDWGPIIGITDDALENYNECVFPSLAHNTDNYLHLIYQESSMPGTFIYTEHARESSSMNYLKIPKSDFSGVNKLEEVNNIIKVYPNPTSDFVNINLKIAQSANVNIVVSNIMGQNVFVKDYGKLMSGNNMITINTSGLPAGIYLITVNAGSNKSIEKLVVN